MASAVSTATIADLKAMVSGTENTVRLWGELSHTSGISTLLVFKEGLAKMTSP
jgi:hypothetical protein